MNGGEKIAGIGFLIHDAVRRTSIVPALGFLMKSQLWSDEEMHQYRLTKLRSLIRHASDHVPYYRDLFRENHIHPEDIRSFNDLGLIPLLTKDIARENQKRLIADNISLRFTKHGKTGGTTGSPLEVYKDTTDRSFAWASYYRWYNWIGIAKEERVLTLWGAKLVLGSSIKQRITDKLAGILENSYTLNSFALGEKTAGEFYKKLVKINPVLLKGYVSSLIVLANYMKENNLPPNRNLRALSGTSEMILPAHRALLENTFSVPFYDQYGCGEASAVSYECTGHKGLHINEEHVIVECLNDNNTNILDAPGRVVVTTLDNFIMPFIRFENGDIASLYSQKCSCGISSHLMSHVDGRVVETITVRNGGKVHGVFFSDILFELNINTDLIKRFQVSQHKDGSVDFLLETPYTIPESLQKKLEMSLLRFLDNVNIKVVPFIPSEKNGKFRYIRQVD